jgi:hypothetical protein
MKNNKYGVFYFLNDNKKKYWIGTFTNDKTACEKVLLDNIPSLNLATKICHKLNSYQL